LGESELSLVFKIIVSYARLSWMPIGTPSSSAGSQITTRFSPGLSPHSPGWPARFKRQLRPTKKALHLQPKMSALWMSPMQEPGMTDAHLFGNPAVPWSGPVALRHQIALALPFRRTADSENVLFLVAGKTSSGQVNSGRRPGNS
jgi:hypothetical protein